MRHKWLRRLSCVLLGHPTGMCHIVQRHAILCDYCGGEWIKR